MLYPFSMVCNFLLIETLQKYDSLSKFITSSRHAPPKNSEHCKNVPSPSNNQKFYVKFFLFLDTPTRNFTSMPFKICN